MSPHVCCRAAQEPDLHDGEVLVAVDLAGRAPDDAVARGETARAALGPALVRAGAARLRASTAGVPDAAARTEALATLVPEYVTLPRGAQPASGTVTWSRDHR